MFTRLPMYQRQGSAALKKDLTNIKALCQVLNEPQKKYPVVHVAGTNGKGSTSHMIASVLQEAGYKVGLYTSPHLKDFRERIRIDGLPIGKETVVDFIALHEQFLTKQQLSFFELTVGMAFDYFAAEEVDIAVVEVGLGGRLDSTNIVNPLVSVITNIGLDHTQYLGETLPEIAFEKAGIIKTKIPVIIGEFQEEVFNVFQEKANAMKSPIFIADQLVVDLYDTDLLGAYQSKNVKTAVQCVRTLREIGFEISEESLKNGLLNVVGQTGLKGRWQVLRERPMVVCDTAHNREGLTSVMKQLMEQKYDDLHIVLGVVNDKDLPSILEFFPKMAHYYFCKPDIPRGLDANVLKQEGDRIGLFGDVYPSVQSAYKDALSKAWENDFIYVGGSTFVVAELDL